MDDKETKEAASTFSGCAAILAYAAFAVLASIALGLLVAAWAGFALMAFFALLGAFVMRMTARKLKNDAKGEDDDRVA